jgi:hypothetical protein
LAGRFGSGFCSVALGSGSALAGDASSFGVSSGDGSGSTAGLTSATRPSGFASGFASGATSASPTALSAASPVAGSPTSGSAEVCSFSGSIADKGRGVGKISILMAVALGATLPLGIGSVTIIGRSSASPIAWMMPA